MEVETSSIASLKGTDVPTLQHLNAHVRPLIADVWYDLGLQLLDPEDQSRLDTIKANKPGDANGACTEMFSLWLEKYPSTSWNSLISTIKGPGVEKHNVANKIEQMLQPAAPVAMDTSTLPVDTSSSPCYADLFKSKSIFDAYTSLITRLNKLLKEADLSSLKLALTSQAKTPNGIELKKPLNVAIKNAKTSYDLLMTLGEHSDSNWLDTRLLEAVVNGSELSGAENLIKAYREFLSSKKLSEVLSEFPESFKKRKMYFTKVCAKINVSKDITIGDLFRYCDHLEDVILNLGKRVLRIKNIKKGCLEISLSTTQSSFSTYQSALQNFQKFFRICLLSLKVSAHPVVYDPWLFDLDEQSVTRKEVFYEQEVATQLCNILLENAPVDDIITVFSSRDLLMGDDLIVVNNAPSDYLKKMFLLRLLQNVSLSVWSTICDVVNKSEILKHLSDQLVYEPKSSTQLERVSADTDTNMKDELPLVTYSLRGTKMISMDDSAAVTALHTFPKPSRRRSSSFCQLSCLNHLRPSTVERAFQYTVRHVIELLSCCDPNLLIKWCENLMASHTHQIKLFTANFMDKIKQHKTSPAVLKFLSHYWTWSNYSLLKVLAQFSKLALDMLEEFDARVNTAVPITEYPISSLAVSMFPYDTSAYTELIFECDQKLNHSLQLVFDMQSLITKNCDITQHALLLLAVDSNPTRLYWMIPKSVVTIVNAKVMGCSQLLFSKGVMRIFIYPSTVHVLNTAITVWPYMFLNKNEKEDGVKVLRPPTDQLHMLQHVRNQRDGWCARAKQSEEAEKKFRTGYEREEQKYKELKEQKSKEAETVAKFKEKFASCRESLEMTIKVLTGDSEDLPATVTEPTKEYMQMESVQQLEQDLEYLEQLTRHLLHKSMEQREEQSKSSQQLEQKSLQKSLQKEKEIEDMKSEIFAKDSKLDDLKKKEKELIKMSSDLKLQKDRLNMRLEECYNELTKCQKSLKDKDSDISDARIRNEEMVCQMSELEEQLLEEKKNHLDSKLSIIELTSKNNQLQQEVKEMGRQRQKILDDLTAENERLKLQIQTSNDYYVIEKEFRKQLAVEINMLRKRAAEKDMQIHRLQDTFIAEKREKEQLQEQITKLNKFDESNQKCDCCGSMNKKVVKYTDDNLICLAHDEYHFFCHDCYKRSYYCPVHSTT